MLPRTHILFGGIFAIILWLVAPSIPLMYLGLVWFASVFIDFDHYAASVIKAGTWRLRDSFEYHRKLGKIEIEEKKKGIKRRGDFHLFHTVEFHLLVGLLGVLVWEGFYYLFIGMVFHSLLDVYSILKRGVFYRREYFLSAWVARKIKD